MNPIEYYDTAAGFLMMEGCIFLFGLLLASLTDNRILQVVIMGVAVVLVLLLLRCSECCA